VIYTCSYRAWREELGVPIRTSVGPPRSFPAPLIELPCVYPFGLVDVTDPEELRRRYRARLWRQKPRVLRELEELRQGYGDLVLLCFEPVGKLCHRRILSQWLEEQLGEEIPERG
jgi:hypothetical protein